MDDDVVAAHPAVHLERLNPEQRRAATFDGEALMVVAGAGTGKTGTLAARVADLLMRGVRPDRILLLTFTRRAAQEMIRRVDSIAPQGGAAHVWGGTFHSVANRILRQWGSAIGVDPALTVLDQADAVELFGLVRGEEADAAGRRFPRRETLAAVYDRMISSQTKLTQVLAADFPWCNDHAEVMARIFTAYTARKRSGNVVDYDDLLLLWRGLLASPVVGPQVLSRFEHVVVDEFQDTNPIQADIVHRYGDAGAHITVVGDDAQAIYGFRNATVANMWDFENRRPGSERLTLEQNYRSTTPILDVANDVLAGPDGEKGPHFDKRLWSTRVGDRRPRLVTCSDESAQSVAVAERILELREEGIGLADQAVLFRAAHHSDLLELELAARDIPFVKFGGLKFLETAHVKDLLALLRVLENPRDELAWHRALRLLPTVGPAGIRRIKDAIGVTGTDPDAPLRKFIAGEWPIPSGAVEAATGLRDALRECAASDPTPSVPVQIDHLRVALEPLFEVRYDRSAVRAGDLQQLAVLAGDVADRSTLLTELVLDPPSRTGDLADEPHLDDEYLTLSTVHSAKGGEWKAVHLIHAADGNIPSDMALKEKGGLDEERRLAYVALTRAMDVLDVYVPLRYHHRRTGSDDAHNFAPVSRFFSPIRERFDEVAAGTGVGVDATVEATTRVGVMDEVDAMLHGLWS